MMIIGTNHTNTPNWNKRVDDTIGTYYSRFACDNLERTAPLLPSMTSSMKPFTIKKGAMGSIRTTVTGEGKTPLEIANCFRTILMNDLEDVTSNECVTNHLLRRMVLNIGGESGAIKRTKTPTGTLIANPTQREVDIVIFRRFLDNSQCLPWQDIHAFDLPYRSKRFVETLYKACDSFQSENDFAGREEYTNYVRNYQGVITYYESRLRLIAN